VYFLQKLKWNGFQIDTLEEIYYDVSDKLIYKTNPLAFDENDSKNKKVKAIGWQLDDDYRNALNQYEPEFTK